MANDKKKKTMLFYSIISFVIITLIVIFIFKYDDIDKSLVNVIQETNGKLSASVNSITYSCSDSKATVYNGKCYKCSDNYTFNSYDQMCYKNASYDAKSCTAPNTYYYDDPNYVSEPYCVATLAVPIGSVECAKKTNYAYTLYGTYFSCRKLVQKPGKYYCNSSSDTLVTLIPKYGSYGQKGNFCRQKATIVGDAKAIQLSTSKTYVVSFYAGDYGTINGKKSFTTTCTTANGEEGCKIKVPKVVPLDGYSLNRWQMKENLGTLYIKDSVNEIEVSKDYIFDAKYNYYVQFNYNGGKDDENNTSHRVQCAILSYYGNIHCEHFPENISKNGYTFLGWTENNKAIKEYPSGPTTLYAAWAIADDYDYNEGKEYVATFDPNGGTIEEDDNTIKKSSGSKLGALYLPIRSDYTFKEWNTKADGTGTTVDCLTRMPSYNVTYYAIWEKKSSSSSTTTPKYIATFSANGGTIQGSNIIQIESGEALGVLPTVTRTGYTFNGWYTAKTGGTKITQATKMQSKNVTYYAQWTKSKYKVSYVYKGDYSKCTTSYKKDDNKNWSETVIYGSSYYIQKNWWTCPGYEFTGWNEKADGTGIEWQPGSTWAKWGTYKSDTYEHDVTLYAQWVPLIYKVVYHGNGGTYNESDIWVDPRDFVYYEEYPGSNDNVPLIYDNSYFFVKKGYKFTGWKTKAGYAGWTAGYSGDTTKRWNWYDGFKENNVSIGIGAEKKQQLDLYAQWTPITYTIKFDKNAPEATGSMANINKTYGVSTKAPKNNFVRPAYIFKGWNTHADGSGTKITDGGPIGTLTTIDKNEMILYAQWVSIDSDIGVVENEYIISDQGDTLSDIKKLNKYTIAEAYDNNRKMNDTDKLKSGTILKIGDNQYKVVIKGDLTGDGIVSILDVAEAYKAYKKKETLSRIKSLALDLTNDNKISILDIAELYKMYKEN